MRHIQAGNKETITVVSLCKMTRNMGVFSYLHCFHAVAGETCFFLFGPGGSWVGGRLKRPFETVFQSVSDRLQERREKTEMIGERKTAPLPTASTARTVAPCTTTVPISRTPWH